MSDPSKDWRLPNQLLRGLSLLVLTCLCIGADEAATIPRLASPPEIEDFLNQDPGYPTLELRDFRQKMPGDGEPVSLPTRVHLGFDDKNLYVVFVCEEKPGLVRARRSKREDIDNDDVVAVFLDTFHDRQRAYLFAVNPRGIQLDAFRTEGQQDDDSFDTLWHSRGKLTDDGYIVWMAIPFKSLRFPNREKQTWGLAVGRKITRLNEESYWPYITERNEGFVQQMATVEMPARISPGRNVQVIPYGAYSDAKFLDREKPGGPDFDTHRELRAGVDVKAVIKDAITVDLTVNPDFSQVESDEPQTTVNQRFEVFFPERRPFFIENAGYFRTPINLFFSRRIQHPEFGARVTGKLGAWAFGALGMDDRAPGENLSSSDEPHGRRAGNAVVRVQREFGRQSTVGVFGSGRSFGSDSNEVAALDTRLRFSDNWVFTGQVATSRTQSGEQEKLRGPAYFGSLYFNDRNWRWGVEYLDVSPDFRSELGFVPRVDIRKADHRLFYSWKREKGAVVSFGPGSHYNAIWNHQGQLQEWMIDNLFNLELKGQTRITGWWGEGYVRHRGMDFRQRFPGFLVSSERLKWLVFRMIVSGGRQVNFFPAEGLAPFLGDKRGFTGTVTVLPTPALRWEQSYIFNGLKVRKDDPAQGLVKGTPVFNNHILRSKVNYQFTRPLSLRFIFEYQSVLPNSSLVDLEKSKRPVFDILLTYLLNPGTALYAGYTERRENLAIEYAEPRSLVPTQYPDLRTDRQVFVKLSYLIRF
jgi:uncharacterized protein DUF5916